MRYANYLRSLAATSCLLLTACAGTGRVTEVADAGCYWARPIYVSRGDVLTDETARQVLAHNETWARRCRSEQ